MRTASLPLTSDLVVSGSMALDFALHDLSDDEHIHIQPWRRFVGQTGSHQPVKRLTCFWDGKEHLHAPELVSLWTKLRSEHDADDCTLLYLHRGHQIDTKTPLLQHLLNLLDHKGAVFALRVESEADHEDAQAFAQALASDHGAVLVLHDPTDRLLIVENSFDDAAPSSPLSSHAPTLPTQLHYQLLKARA